MPDDLADLEKLTCECRDTVRSRKSSALVSAFGSLDRAIKAVGASWSGSYLGYQSQLYLEGFRAPQHGEMFDSMWGFISSRQNKTRGPWRHYADHEVDAAILERACGVDLDLIEQSAAMARETFEACRQELVGTLDAAEDAGKSTALQELASTAEQLPSHVPRSSFLSAMKPSGEIPTRDDSAWPGGFRVPWHLERRAWLLEAESCFEQCEKLVRLSERAIRYMKHQNHVGHGGITNRGHNDGAEKPISTRLARRSARPRFLYLGALFAMILAFVIGIGGNLIADWLRQDVLWSRLPPGAIAGILVITGLALLLAAWIDARRNLF